MLERPDRTFSNSIDQVNHDKGRPVDECLVFDAVLTSGRFTIASRNAAEATGPLVATRAGSGC